MFNQPVSQSLVSALVAWASVCAAGQGIFKTQKTKRENKQSPKETPCNHRTMTLPPAMLGQGSSEHFTEARVLLS